MHAITCTLHFRRCEFRDQRTYSHVEFSIEGLPHIACQLIGFCFNANDRHFAKTDGRLVTATVFRVNSPIGGFRTELCARVALDRSAPYDYDYWQENVFLVG